MNRMIAALTAREILDSPGWPTIKVVVRLKGSVAASASGPSGASTGQFEAHELRDGDPARYSGRGVLEAIANIEREIAPAHIGIDAARQPEIDRLTCELDGTENKARLGADANLGVSLAVARAAAEASKMPLYEYLGGPTARRLPVPMLNIINGDKHADSGLEMQEFMIVPHGAPTYGEALELRDGGCFRR